MYVQSLLIVKILKEQPTCSFNENISEQSDSTITKVLLFGGNKLDFELNKTLLMSAVSGYGENFVNLLNIFIFIILGGN